MAPPLAMSSGLGRRMHSTGFWVPWIVSTSWPPLEMLQSVLQYLLIFPLTFQGAHHESRAAFLCWTSQTHDPSAF